jgi:transposase InsO family protein
MDLASRRIVGYDLSNHDYTSKEAIHIFEKALFLEALVKPSRPVEYVHTDSAGIFLSKDWKEFLEVNKIVASSSDSKKMQNQVSERFNRTFKCILREFLNKKLNKSNNKTNRFQLIGEATKYNFENLKTLTEEVIFYYNIKRPHKHLNDLAPDTWAYEARRIPDQKYILKEKTLLTSNIVELDSKQSEPLINKENKEKMNLASCEIRRSLQNQCESFLLVYMGQLHSLF